MNTLFATTAQGFEELLKSELETLGAQSCKIVLGGVHFQADDRLLYSTLQWSRLASRIMLMLHEFNINSNRDLYYGVLSVDWPSLFSVDKSFNIHFSGTNNNIRNSQYGALKVKDAIVDCFTRHQARRPNVEHQKSDIKIRAYLHHAHVMLLLDLSGDSLHKRGYRNTAGDAPLKETLAAAIIKRSGWQPNTPFLDPMCGSGTLIIEAAMIAADHAPGLARRCWGFTAWRGHNEALWQSVCDDSIKRAKHGLAKTKACFFGSDNNVYLVEKARKNANQAGILSLINLSVTDIANLTNPLPDGPCGTVVSNPPYGERLESEPKLIALYNLLGRVMKSQFCGWRLSLFSTLPGLFSALTLRAERSFKAKNGQIDCEQKNYQLAATHTNTPETKIAVDFANRLHKNLRSLKKWVVREKLTCYRLYDSDLPDYNVAIDRYSSWVIIQEYIAPKNIDPKCARQRLYDVIAVTRAVLDIPANHLIVKARVQQKGNNQYKKLAQKNELLLVEEYNAKLWVNLTDYLDTGLFLDHRITRKILGKMSYNKDFLNLFAYTATASVHAGLGGARSTTSVDISRTYLEWAKKNLHSNGLDDSHHHVIQADCLVWLKTCTKMFDIIFVDPPTFSNSKRMMHIFDVQLDHLALIKDLKPLLRVGGTIIFSNNKRGFQLDNMGLQVLGLEAQSITEHTISRDFTRSRQIHNCWLINHIDSPEKYSSRMINSYLIKTT